MKKLSFSGHVDESGKLQIDRQLFASTVKQFSGKEITLTIEKRSKHRSNQQNSYLWAVVYPCVLHGLIEVGYDIEPNDTELAHEWCKKEFLENRKIGKKDVQNGSDDYITLPASTTGLTTEEFNQYIERISQFSAEYLGVVIPAPTAEWMWPEHEIVSV